MFFTSFAPAIAAGVMTGTPRLALRARAMAADGDRCAMQVWREEFHPYVLHHSIVSGWDYDEEAARIFPLLPQCNDACPCME